MPKVSAANSRVRSRAGSGRPKGAAWPDQKGVKSPEPADLDLALKGWRAPAATGNAGTSSAIGPNSRTALLTIARAARPVKTLVTTVWSSCTAANALRYIVSTVASGQNKHAV